MTDADAALAACSREPIHIPGAIQPHGALLTADAATLVCRQASENTSEFLDRAPADLVGLPLDQFLSLEGPEPLGHVLCDSAGVRERILSLTCAGRSLDGIAHHQGDVLILELEPATSEQRTAHFHRRLQGIFADLRSAPAVSDLFRLCARFISDLTGFERVMVYKFDADWHGEVVGEWLSAPVDSYMGHHFPASDIPDQARALYRKNWLRLIPTADYQPVPLVPSIDPGLQGPLDLSFSVLRSVSPIHLEYLRNMDVAASMSISIIVEGRLWGLIACHHRTPLYLSPQKRAACELFGQVFSLEISSREETERLREQKMAATVQTRFFDFIANESNFVEALVKYTPHLLEFMNAGGAAISVNGNLTQLGITPNRSDIESLVGWLTAMKLNPIFATDRLSHDFPDAAVHQERASGLLAVKLSAVEDHFVIWFRPEVVSTITWAGDPRKPVETDLRVHPRKSFTAWQETVRGRSLPWSEVEREGARELRAALNALVLRRTERLIRLNAELEQKNTDLNSFAYIASHDLKEPLRGIVRYSTFLREDHGHEWPDEACQRLSVIENLARRSEELLETLGHFSRIGRMEISRRPTDLEAVLQEVLESLHTTIEGENIEILRLSRLPVANCDPVLMREVLLNLITNAVRYNETSPKIVEIGSHPAEGHMTISVRDNGIGIPERHHQAIFQIFRRLHAHGSYGEGSGAGLAIVKSIVERHGGSIQVESEVGRGSTFTITLP